jgi:hypothetical protein
MLEEKADTNTSSLISIAPEYSKGSVEVARGGKPSLQGKPKLEHRNTVVRDVKRGLSMRGIEIDSDSSSVDSEYDEEADRLFGSKSRNVEPQPRPSRKHRVTEKEDKPTYAPQAPARISRLEAGGKRDTEISDSRQGDIRTTDQSKFKSAARMAVAVLPKGRRSSNAEDDGEIVSQGIKMSGGSSGIPTDAYRWTV